MKIKAKYQQQMPGPKTVGSDGDRQGNELSKIKQLDLDHKLGCKMQILKF